MAEEQATTEELKEEAPATEEQGSGPGFIFGVLLGMLAGAAGATLFAPSTGEELRHRVSEETSLPEGEGQSDAAASRLQAVLGRVRARVREASVEAREAAQKAESKTRARYEELTGQEAS